MEWRKWIGENGVMEWKGRTGASRPPSETETMYIKMKSAPTKSQRKNSIQFNKHDYKKILRLSKVLGGFAAHPTTH